MTKTGLALLLLLPLTACSSKELQRATYETLQNRQCLEERGVSRCSDQQSYDEYTRKREAVLGDR